MEWNGKERKGKEENKKQHKSHILCKRILQPSTPSSPFVATFFRNETARRFGRIFWTFAQTGLPSFVQLVHLSSGQTSSPVLDSVVVDVAARGAEKKNHATWEELTSTVVDKYIKIILGTGSRRLNIPSSTRIEFTCPVDGPTNPLAHLVFLASFGCWRVWILQHPVLV